MLHEGVGWLQVKQLGSWAEKEMNDGGKLTAVKTFLADIIRDYGRHQSGNIHTLFDPLPDLGR